MKDLSYLIPLYNEEINIVPTVETLIRASELRRLNYEIIITDDASTDGSLGVAIQLEEKYPQVRVYKNEVNSGFARTYFNTLKKSEAEYVMYIASDNDIDEKNLEVMLAHLGKAPVILQYCLNPKDRRLYRYWISKFYTLLMNRVNRVAIQYYNGFNIYRTSLVKGLVIEEESFAFQADIVSKLVQENAYIQVPISCHFHDENSSALNFKNIKGVLFFLVKKLFLPSKRKV